MPKVIRTMEDLRESELKRQARNQRKTIKTREKTQTYTVRVYRDSATMAAIEKAAQDAGKQPGRYLRIALMEKLKRDGYIAEMPNDDEEE